MSNRLSTLAVIDGRIASRWRLLSVLTLIVLLAELQAAPWTNKEGKTIEADLVRIEGEIALLEMEGKTFKVPLDQLNEDSQGFARFVQAKRKEWVAAHVGSPIITEQVLQSIARYDPGAAKGKRFLVEGYVKSISDSPSGPAKKANETSAYVKLVGGTEVEVDFAGKVDNNSTKISVDPDGSKVHMTKYTKISVAGRTDHKPVGVLMEKGEEIVVRCMVEDGKVVGSGMATTAEITKARLEFAKMYGDVSMEDVVALERIKNRIEFLEMQLSGNAGTASINSNYGNVGSLTFHYSDAEKEAMRKELELLKAQIAAAAKPQR